MKASTLLLFAPIGFVLAFVFMQPGTAQAQGQTNSAAQAMNALALDLLGQPEMASGNALIAPYSIQSALAMTYAGADGDTKDEMAKALHYPKDEAALHSSFAALQASLTDMAQQTAQRAAMLKQRGEASEPVILTVANRLFGDRGYEFQQPFLKQMQDVYHAPMDLLDFRGKPEPSRATINQWVEAQTQNRIEGLIPVGGIDESSRLVLVNAVYLKAPWHHLFEPESTKPAAFYVKAVEAKQVPTMVSRQYCGYEQRDGYTAVTLPYVGGQLHFLILLPDASSDVMALQRKLTPDTLVACGQVGAREIVLFLPKLDLRPSVMALADQLKALGMVKAFSPTPGVANFNRMALPQEAGNLCVSQVFHKTFLKLDEKGTEAAAATAVAMVFATAVRAEPPEVHVDRPFLFAIQHRETGACLFVGRVVEPNR